MVTHMPAATLNKPKFQCVGTAVRTGQQCGNTVDRHGALCGRCSGVIHPSTDPTLQREEAQRVAAVRVDAHRLAHAEWITGLDDDPAPEFQFGEVPSIDEDIPPIDMDALGPPTMQPPHLQPSQDDFDALNAILADYDTQRGFTPASQPGGGGGVPPRHRNRGVRGSEPNRPHGDDADLARHVDETLDMIAADHDEDAAAHRRQQRGRVRAALGSMRRSLRGRSSGRGGLLSGMGRGGNGGAGGGEGDGLFARIFKVLTGSGRG